MNVLHLDASAGVQFAPLTNRDILGAAWLCEQAARACEFDGQAVWARQLRADASRFRKMALDEPGGAA